MSFLPGRLVATEGAFFREQTKAAAKLLKEKLDPQSLASSCSSPATNVHADTLPEILMHSLPVSPPGLTPAAPLKLRPSLVPEASTLAVVSKSIMRQATKSDGARTIGMSRLTGTDAIDLFTPSVPSQTTFGPRRWSVEFSPGCQPVPSTANAARLETEPIVDPPTQEEVRQGMISIAKAFGAATTLVFGGAALGIGLLGYHLEWHSLEDVRTKSRDGMTPYVAAIRQWFKPTQQWAHNKGEKWKMEEAERQALGIQFAESLGVQPAEQMKWKNSIGLVDKQDA